MTHSAEINQEVHELGEVMWSSCLGRHRDVVAGAALNILANVALQSANRNKAKAELVLRLMVDEAIAQMHRHGEATQ